MTEKASPKGTRGTLLIAQLLNVKMREELIAENGVGHAEDQILIR